MEIIKAKNVSEIADQVAVIVDVPGGGLFYRLKAVKILKIRKGSEFKRSNGANVLSKVAEIRFNAFSAAQRAESIAIAETYFFNL
jgi:hypothetical protein